MRYSILGFNQEELIKYDIDMSDVLLMDYIQKALSQPSMQKKNKDNQPYVWLNHTKIIEDLPILKIGESMLKKRLSKLINLGLIEAITVSNESNRGTKTYYTITNLFESLQFSDADMTRDKKFSVVERPGIKNSPSDNKLIIDNKLINTISKDIVEEKPKKKNLYEKCVDTIDNFTESEEVRDLLRTYLRYRLEIKDKPIYVNQWIGMLNKLRDLTDSKTECMEIIQQSIDRGYLSFFPISKSKQSRSTACETNVSCATMTEEEIEKQTKFVEELKSRGKQVEF